MIKFLKKGPSWFILPDNRVYTFVNNEESITYEGEKGRLVEFDKDVLIEVSDVCL